MPDKQSKKKDLRRKRVLDYIQIRLMEKNVTPATATRLMYEAQQIKFYLDGGKKQKRKKVAQTGQSKETVKWYIDIYSVQFAPVKRSERRKNKGKSRKKLKKKRQTVFLKSVVAQPNMISNYLEGRMGLSPKQHAFKMRREDMARQ